MWVPQWDMVPTCGAIPWCSSWHRIGPTCLTDGLLDESVTHFLQQLNEPLSYHFEVNRCYGISLVLAYLYLNDIIHWDLSSKNVLLIAGNRTKIANFGMSKLSGLHPHITPLTQCQGTAVYMPHKELPNPTVYSKEIKKNSTGDIAVWIMTWNFPDPGPATIVCEGLSV